jgi:hypothetical protein
VSDEKSLTVKAIENLSAKEAYALKYFSEKRQAEVSFEKAEQLYQLYVNGKTTEDILRLNNGLTLAQIVHAKVRDKWDLRKQEKEENVIASAAPQIMQTQIESSLFMKDLLTAAIKLHWDSIQLFIQTGDKSHLKGTPLENGVSLKQIRDIIDTLQAATGQDKKKVVEHRGGVTVTSGKLDDKQAVTALEILALDDD